MPEKHSIDPKNAHDIARWFRDRGGIAIWRSAVIGSHQTFTAPLRDEQGNLKGAEDIRWDTQPVRVITDPAEVNVVKGRELRRFHVATRMGGQGLTIKLTDGGSNKLRKAMEKARQEHGDAWYEFDYGDYNNAVIFVPDGTVSLPEWMEENLPKVVG
jgi:hypothetical protein